MINGSFRGLGYASNYFTTADPGGVIVYADDQTNSGGKQVLLPPGDYTLAKLQAAGVKDNDIDSIKVVPPYTIEIFQGPNFDGNSRLLSASDSGLIHSGYHDNVSSVKVRNIAQDAIAKVADQQLVSTTIDPNTKRVLIFGGAGLALLTVLLLLLPDHKK